MPPVADQTHTKVGIRPRPLPEGNPRDTLTDLRASQEVDICHPQHLEHEAVVSSARVVPSPQTNILVYDSIPSRAVTVDFACSGIVTDSTEA